MDQQKAAAEVQGHEGASVLAANAAEIADKPPAGSPASAPRRWRTATSSADALSSDLSNSAYSGK